VSDYGEWESRLQACNDAGCGAPIMYKFSVEPAPERAAAGLRLAPALDADGKPLPLTVAASWDPVAAAASYTLDWRRVEADPQTPEPTQPNRARQTRGASGPVENQLTVPGDQTAADLTVPDGGWYRVRLRVNGEDGGVIGQSDNQIEVLSYQQGYVFLFYTYDFNITGTRAEPVYGGVKVSWHHAYYPSIIKYQYKVLHRDEWCKPDEGCEPEEGEWTDVPGSGPDTTSYTVTGLEDGETYAVWVQAVTEKGTLHLNYFVIVTTPWYVSVDSSIYGETDYDTDDDGLIEIADAYQLNAIRWDLDGDGTAAAGSQAAYSEAFPGRLQGMGCPDSGCKGYEIGTGADGEAAITIDMDVMPFNTGAGWVPIGPFISYLQPYGFGAILEGNGNVIDNLFINKTPNNGGNLALFDTISSRGKVRNLGLTNVSVTGSGSVHRKAGALTAVNAGLIRNSYSTGTISVDGSWDTEVGGLVGYNRYGTIHTSHSSVTVTASNTRGSYLSAGGLIGYGWQALVAASYATGSVTATDGRAWRGGMGGLAGRNLGSTIRASYSTGEVTLPSGSRVPAGGLVGLNMRSLGPNGIVAHSYYDSETSSRSDTGKGVGKTTAELQSPTGYTGIYANWNLDLDGDGNRDNPWNFGTSSDYPTLN